MLDYLKGIMDDIKLKEFRGDIRNFLASNGYGQLSWITLISKDTIADEIVILSAVRDHPKTQSKTVHKKAIKIPKNALYIWNFLANIRSTDEMNRDYFKIFFELLPSDKSQYFESSHIYYSDYHPRDGELVDVYVANIFRKRLLYPDKSLVMDSSALIDVASHLARALPKMNGDEIAELIESLK